MVVAVILDAHGHIGGWGEFLIPDPSAAGLVSTMDDLGIDSIGVSDLLAVAGDPVAGNARALEAAALFPGRVGVWLVYSPHHGIDPDLLDAPGVWGLKLHPDVHAVALDDPAYDRAFELAAAHGAPILAHGQTDSAWSDPQRFETMGRRRPDVSLLMGHAGLWPYGFARAARVAERTPSVFLEICGSRMTGRQLARLVEAAGAERVIFGTDACFLDMRMGFGKVMLAPIEAAHRDLVLGDNLVRLLGKRLERTAGA